MNQIDKFLLYFFLSAALAFGSSLVISVIQLVRN